MGRLIPSGTGSQHLRNVVVTDSDAEAGLKLIVKLKKAILTRFRLQM